MKTAHVALTPDQVAHLTKLTNNGNVAVKTYRRAQALLALHQGLSYAAVATQQQVRYATVWQ
jgi:predicted PurR-regulated permease PerM